VTVAARRIVLVMSIGMVAASAASADVSPTWARTDIGPRFSVRYLNGRGVGVGGWGGRSHHHALVWEQGEGRADRSRHLRRKREQSHSHQRAVTGDRLVAAEEWRCSCLPLARGTHAGSRHLGGRRSEPAALNERGQVVGTAEVSAKTEAVERTHSSGRTVASATLAPRAGREATR